MVVWRPHVDYPAGNGACGRIGLRLRMNLTIEPVGQHLRAWRQRRRLSQLDLALDAEISARHLSFVETGRAAPSRDMILHLCERLNVPWRERNRMLMAGGFAPLIPERPLSDPALHAVRAAVDSVLAAHRPFPALAVDRHWTMVAANDAVHALLHGLDPAVLEPPVNVLRLSLRPDGLAPRIANFAQWRHHLLQRLQQQVEATADPDLADLASDLRRYPVVPQAAGQGVIADSAGGLVIPLRLITPLGVLSFISTTMVFGTPLDVTSSELAIESFFPADDATARALAARAAHA
jgi:transcriptional regulator with XRE-family HTH domain